MLSDLFSSFFVYADAKQEEPEKEEQVNSDQAEEKSEEKGDDEEGEASSEETPEEEEEADEPEDIHPTIREECSNSAKCAPLKKHFDHCQEKVQGGHGFKGEDCVEEMCK